MALTTAKAAEVMFENALETHEKQTQFLTLTDFYEPDAADMQNAGNVLWKPVQQHAPIIAGWDLTGSETGIIEEAYPSILGTPDNDFVEQRADDMRSESFWKKRGEASGKRQASELNKNIATAIAQQGGIYYRSNATNGYKFIAQAQTLMNERQLHDSGRVFVLNDRDNMLFAEDLAGRQTLQGRPESSWATSQIGSNVAGFDLYVSSANPNITGGADPATTVTGNHSFAPEAGTVTTATGIVTNTDYRSASFVVADSSGYSVGDKVTIANSGTAIKALGLEDKTDTGQAMTFSIVAIADSTHITVYPKPIAADDSALTDLQKAYANVDTTALNAATVNRVNIDATQKTNLFWDKSAIEIMGGSIPSNLFSEFDGMKQMQETMPNGQTMYMVYDGNIATMNFRYRLFTWYGITVANPSNCGVAVTY